ncbi:MAG: hypothetical protein BECKG1743D_GA0114223_108281 [Candidatus Kentron sp. G]|nr:MAG: hypothetical protein BECKG1743F_GA0114225_107803 [Candidatus Kentron sp. G]VFN05036.1 MAG: hypothetical protein BECKG1743E_GA0114224_108131 [Candidatus Kentron sp. G]VFN06205.1 MAG: hypothetical protein BECKG1743D_GA0114223_108281 [Candidatus Kentron sp. G]
MYCNDSYIVHYAPVIATQKLDDKDKQVGIFFDRNRLRYWIAIDIAIRYRYRSCPAFSIASSDIDSDPEKTTTPVAPWLR